MDSLALVVSTGTAFVAMYVVYRVMGIDLPDYLFIAQQRLTSFCAASACVILYMFFNGHYHRRMPHWDEAKGVVVAAGLGALLEAFFIFANKADVSRGALLVTWFAMPWFVMWFRSLRNRLGVRKQGIGFRSVLFGKEPHTKIAMSLLNADLHLEYDVKAVGEHRDVDSALRFMADNNANEAIFALSCADEGEIALAVAVRKAGFPVSVIPPAMGISSNLEVKYLLGHDSVVLVGRPEVTPRLNRAAKRVFDIVVAGIVLAVLSIPMACVAGLIALDGGSPFFRHERVGRNGRNFGCLKFRSMRVNAERHLEEYLASSPEARIAWDLSRKLPNDPRVTKIGQLLRRTSIDELPQLLNVLRGDMSLVGPRPITEAELENYGKSKSLYMSVAPGVTGLWQVSGRSDLTYERRVALDTWYVENWSPWHDIAILAKTVPAVLGRSGAY